MNQENLEYLQDQVLYTGFGINHHDELEQKLKEGKKDFITNHTSLYGNDLVDAALNFSKGTAKEIDAKGVEIEIERYYFNNYHVKLSKENEKESLEQTFYINKGSNVTLKEAYNMMQGRSVHKELTSKEGEKYNAWLQLDFKQSDDKGNFKIKQYHENYGFDLEAALAKHPIKELKNEEYKNDLIASVKKGNIQTVTFEKDGAEVRHFVEASPQFKSLNVYDENKNRIGQRQTNSAKKGQKEGQTTGKSEAKKTGEVQEPAGEKKQPRKKGQSV